MTLARTTDDMAWGVVEPDTFGTDEFVAWCRAIGAEPSICNNAGNGTGEGRVGFALGAVREQPPNTADDKPDVLPSCLRILLDADGSLVIAGADLGIEDRKLPLPASVLKAMAAGGHRAGITATIGKKALRIVVRARDPDAWWNRKFVAVVPLTAEQRQRLLTRPLALLAQGGYHGVTPFFDPGRVPRERE